MERWLAKVVQTLAQQIAVFIVILAQQIVILNAIKPVDGQVVGTNALVVAMDVHGGMPVLRPAEIVGIVAVAIVLEAVEIHAVENAQAVVKADVYIVVILVV